MTTLYQALKAAGCEIDNHESDLYVKATPQAVHIVRSSGYRYVPFRSELDGQPWLDIFGAYDPFWKRRALK